MNEEILFNTIAYDESFALTGFFLLFAMALLMFALITYVITAISIYKMAENLNIDWAYAAWIPIANSALMVKIVQDKIHPSVREHSILIYVGLLLLNLFSNGMLFPVLLAASLYILFLIYKQYSDNYMKHFVISILTLQISSLISLFMMRNRPAKKDNLV